MDTHWPRPTLAPHGSLLSPEGDGQHCPLRSPSGVTHSLGNWALTATAPSSTKKQQCHMIHKTVTKLYTRLRLMVTASTLVCYLPICTCFSPSSKLNAHHFNAWVTAFSFNRSVCETSPPMHPGPCLYFPPKQRTVDLKYRISAWLPGFSDSRVIPSHNIIFPTGDEGGGGGGEGSVIRSCTLFLQRLTGLL